MKQSKYSADMLSSLEEQYYLYLEILITFEYQKLDRYLQAGLPVLPNFLLWHFYWSVFAEYFMLVCYKSLPLEFCHYNYAFKILLHGIRIFHKGSNDAVNFH